MMQAAEIKTELTRWTKTVSDLEIAARASATKVTELEKQRSACILPARTGDATAQEEAARLDGEIDAARRYSRDDNEALQQARSNVEQLRDALATDQHEQERRRVLHAIKERAAAKLEQRAADLVRELDAVLEDIKLGNNRIAHDLQMLDPALSQEADRIRSAILPIDQPGVRYGNMRRHEALAEFPRVAAERFRRALEAV